MNIRTFIDAGWHKSALSKLEINSCDGLEITSTNQVVSASKKEAFNSIKDTLRHSFPNLKIWVITGHSANQENTSLAHYRKFIKGHEIVLKQHLPADVFEWHTTNSHGLRYFAVMNIKLLSDDAIFQLFDVEKNTWLVATGNDYTSFALSEILTEGWSAEDFPASDNLLQISNSEDFVLAKTFDAPQNNEAGAILIGRTDFLNRFFLEYQRTHLKMQPPK